MTSFHSIFFFGSKNPTLSKLEEGFFVMESGWGMQLDDLVTDCMSKCWPVRAEQNPVLSSSYARWKVNSVLKKKKNVGPQQNQ